jgi:hypothetical protein
MKKEKGKWKMENAKGRKNPALLFKLKTKNYLVI